MKEKEPLVSVIVPVYNVEKYLRRCLDSVINQTYKKLEIILVDDGSTDGSNEIAQEYSRKDERVRVIKQRNLGVAAARNAGIKEATGEYLTQVDADDWVDKEYVKFLVDNTQSGRYDIVTCGEYLVYDESLFPELDRPNCRKVKKNILAVEDMFYQREVNTSSWGKIYKRSLFDGIEYPMGRWYEDLGTTYKLLLRCKTKISVNSKRLYYYIQRQGSISRRDFTQKTLDAVRVIEEVASNIKSQYPELIPAVNSRKLNIYFFVLRQIDKRKNTQEYKELVAKIKALRKPVLKDPNARMKTKGGIIVSYISFELVPILFRILSWTKIVRNLE